METSGVTTLLERKSILADVIRILEETTSDWDLDFSGGITPDTHLIADLWFESIDIVELVVALEEHFERRNLPSEKLLMVDGRYVDDLSITQTVDFLFVHLNA